MLTKDFPYFLDHGFYINEKIDPLAAHLFNLEGEKWRNMRIKLTPTFSSGKMRNMFKTLLDCGCPMIDHVGNLCQKNQDLDIKEILACYTTDIIGSCAFGLECNSFRDPNAEFRSIIDYRTTNMVKRNDFIQLFLEMQEDAEFNNTPGLTLEQIAAQAFAFFQAGFETSSTAMTFCLHELAFNQHIQNKLRQEIKEALLKNNGELSYDAIMDMKYMNKVVNETLRKYPPVAMINRVCSLDYKIPNTNVVLKKGTKNDLTKKTKRNDQHLASYLLAKVLEFVSGLDLD
ncbi:Cyp6a9 [Trypoxylus dichotomus]